MSGLLTQPHQKKLEKIGRCTFGTDAASPDNHRANRNLLVPTVSSGEVRASWSSSCTTFQEAAMTESGGFLIAQYEIARAKRQGRFIRELQDCTRSFQNDEWMVENLGVKPRKNRMVPVTVSTRTGPCQDIRLGQQGIAKHVFDAQSTEDFPELTAGPSHGTETEVDSSSLAADAPTEPAPARTVASCSLEAAPSTSDPATSQEQRDREGRQRTREERGARSSKHRDRSTPEKRTPEISSMTFTTSDPATSQQQRDREVRWRTREERAARSTKHRDQSTPDKRTPEISSMTFTRTRPTKKDRRDRGERNRPCVVSGCSLRTRNMGRHVMSKHIPSRLRNPQLKNMRLHQARIEALEWIMERLPMVGSTLSSLLEWVSQQDEIPHSAETMPGRHSLGEGYLQDRGLEDATPRYPSSQSTARHWRFTGGSLPS